MNNITLYGHLTMDTVFDGAISYKSVGAIGNVWQMLSKLSPNYQINIEPTRIGEALILVNKKKAERSSIANLNLQKRKPYITSASWSHILYINELEDLSFVEEISKTGGIISADTCKGKILSNLDVLKYVDFLFISDEDLFMELNELTKIVKGWVILHNKGGSTCSNGDKTFNVKVPVIDDINVLGAGDMFAGSVIHSILNKVENSDLHSIIKTAHKLTSKHLATINEKN